MINNKKYPIDYRNGSIDCLNIEQRIGKSLSGHAYKCGCYFGFDGFYESDIQWLEDNITKNSRNKNRDIFWQIDGWERGKNISPYYLDYAATFFEGFIDTPGIPRNVNRLLIATVGYMRAWDKKRQTEPYQHFFYRILASQNS